MERKRLVVDLEQIELLEQRVVRATELIRSLRGERDAARSRLDEAQRALEALRGEAARLDDRQRETAELSDRVEVLQQERQAIRGRVTRMLEIMAGIDEGAPQAHGDH
jgi:chromosome segregation ATPase